MTLERHELTASVVPTAPELARAIRLPHATAMVVGTIIGASIFVQPSEITGQVPSIPLIFLVWLVCGLLTLFGALATAELASAFPRTGGVYAFLKETYSPILGFLWGWAMFWSMHSGIIAAVGVVFARYLAYFLPLGDAGIRGAAIAAILALSGINYLGVKQGSTLQAAFTAGKLAAIAVIVVLAFVLGSALPAHFVTGDAAAAAAGSAVAAGVPGGAGAGAFLNAVVAGLFAFGGWHMVTYCAGETVDARRTIPRALLLGTLIVTICYLALNAAYLYVLPLEAVASSTRVAAEAAEALVGRPGGAAISGLVVFSTFGALSGIILAGPRVYYSMAQDGLIFRWLGETHPRFRTPHRAILLQAAWASVLVATGTYRALFTRVVYTEWIFFALMTAGIFLLRRRSGYSPATRMWGHPFTALLFVAASSVIVLNQLVSDPRESAAGLLLVLVGAPVYAWWTRVRR
ncbi:MAG: amino acid permease [Gemmatimonadetes bacterium]|nr:amino acid permease [Gemmatimonadota bacterium]